MNPIHTCRACKPGHMHEKASTEHLHVKGIDLDVSGLLSMECDHCGESLTTPDQIDPNAALVRQAFQERRAQAKRERGLLTGAEISAHRERYGLTKRLAAELFGGGPVAFSKYESEEVVQSEAMDTLLRLSFQFPENLERLAAMKGKVLPSPVLQNTGFRKVTLEPSRAAWLNALIAQIPSSRSALDESAANDTDFRAQMHPRHAKKVWSFG